MGKLKNGAFGGITGKVGNLISYNLNGQCVIRMVAGPSNKPPTINQVNSRQQMKILSAFFFGMETFLKTGFDPKAKGTTWNYYNFAVHYNKPQAITGFHPDLAIDYSKIIFSKGILPPAINPVVLRTPEGLQFSWEFPADTSWPNSEDQVMVMAYSPDTKENIFIQSGAKRTKGVETLILRPSMHNVPLETYISFISDDRLQAADSQYIGTIES